jgi:hypothetical protein
MIKIPKLFYDDHLARELPSPKILKVTKTNYFIDTTDEHIYELFDDADYYCNEIEINDMRGLITSARATKRALQKHIKRGK